MEHYIRGLIDAGASPAQAVDYYMVEVKRFTQTEWGEERSTNQPSISETVNGAKDVLQ